MNDIAERFDEFLLATASTDPHRPAIAQPGAEELSYGQLAAMVDGFGRTLRSLGLDVGDRVVVESDTSASSIAMILACSAAGLPFIPVSPESPDQRLRAVLDVTGAALHVQASGGVRQDLPESVGTGRFGPAGLDIEHAPAPRRRRRHTVVSTDTAYMIFTSGTTGVPKGVVMSHRAVLSFYRASVRRGIITAEDRVATTSPLQFDFALFDIAITLGSGACLVPVPRRLLAFPRRLVSFLDDAGATQLHGVPSLWRPVLRHERDALAALTRLRGVLFSGESFPLPQVRELQAAMPGLRMTNAFGPTETVAFSFTDVPNPLPEDADRLSIADVYDGAEMMILDEDGEPVDEPGVVGEIYLRGPSLFSGYWDDPDATSRALVRDPLDPRTGQLVYRSSDLACRGDNAEVYFCGRSDSQVKVRGNRVELGEVERTLLNYPGVAATAVLAVSDSGGDATLAAFVVLGAGAQAVTEAQLVPFCRRTLPAYMAPRKVYVLPELPVTPNGKTDRRALADLVRQPAAVA